MVEVFRATTVAGMNASTAAHPATDGMLLLDYSFFDVYTFTRTDASSEAGKLSIRSGEADDLNAWTGKLNWKFKQRKKIDTRD